MVKFCDLPPEILLDIVERVPGSISSLSLACRYLNGVTARRLFQTYRLQLRERRKDDSAEGAVRVRAGVGVGVPRCFLTGRSLLALHRDGVDARLRLEHLCKKAAIVRELRIVDYGQPSHEPDVHSGCHRAASSAAYRNAVFGRSRGAAAAAAAPFDITALLPALVETLDALERITSVVFETTDRTRPPARLPDELWQWLSRCKPGKVSFEGYFAFPDPFGWLPPVVGSMSLVMNEEASRVLKVSHCGALSVLVLYFERNTS